METKEIGNVIRSIRESKGITATFMSRKLGYKAVSSYGRIEKGETAVTLEQAKLIADLLNVEVVDFFNTQYLRDMRNKPTA